MQRGALKFLKLGSRVRFRLSDVEEHLAGFYPAK
jgi:excisionase family DNA binding protein